MSSLISLTPSTLISQESLQINLDLVKARTRYVDTGKGFISLGNFRLGRSAFKLLLKGEITTNGIAVNEFNKVTSYSLGFQFDDEKDLDALEKLNDILIKFLDDQLQKTDEWDLNSVVKEDRIYLKLKTDPKKNFLFSSNVKLSPKTLTESGLIRGQKVEIVAELNAYFNFQDQKAGISIQPRSMKFELEDEEPAPKRMKN